METPSREHSQKQLFPTTSWTIVQQMADGTHSVKLRGWEEFATCYCPALTRWLQGRGVSPDEAEDLVQGLMLKLWQQDNLADQLKPESGRLRSFLLVSLKNWWRDELRKQQALRRGGGQHVVEFTDSDAQTDLDDVTDYDHEWAKTTCLRAIHRLRDEYIARGSRALFDQGLPLLESRDENSRAKLAAELKMEANSLTVALKRLRERLAQRLREEVAATLVEPDQLAINEELRHLMTALENMGGLHSIAQDLSPA